jgi:hypothetical protein
MSPHTLNYEGSSYFFVCVGGGRRYIYLRVFSTDRETAFNLDNQTLLGFATLSITTQIGQLLFVAHQPRWEREVQ